MMVRNGLLLKVVVVNTGPREAGPRIVPVDYGREKL